MNEQHYGEKFSNCLTFLCVDCNKEKSFLGSDARGRGRICAECGLEETSKHKEVTTNGKGKK
jgi:hypothetical protein